MSPSPESPMTFKRTSLTTLVVLALLTPLLLGSAGLREDEFECEQAVNHLKGCCAATFDPTKVSCAFDEGGCGDNATYPSLGVDDSKCIEDKSCDAILESGLCDRVE
ncbi:MAG: hypothetical protein ABI461_10525, partial [Polyangiaceae bacterium]